MLLHLLWPRAVPFINHGEVLLKSKICFYLCRYRVVNVVLNWNIIPFCVLCRIQICDSCMCPSLNINTCSYSYLLGSFQSIFKIQSTLFPCSHHQVKATKFDPDVMEKTRCSSFMLALDGGKKRKIIKHFPCGDSILGLLTLWQFNQAFFFTTSCFALSD